MMQQPGRVDQLFVNMVAHLARAHAHPTVVAILDNGGLSLLEYGAPKLLPNQPVNALRIGQMEIPLDLLAAFLRAVKLLPEGPHA